MKPLPLLFCLLLLGAMGADSAPAPATLPASIPGAVKEEDLDLDACKILHGSEVDSIDAQELKTLLGFSGAQPNSSTASAHPLKEGETIQYLLVFKQPLQIGTILGGTGELRVLKPGAPLPANQANPSDWLTVAAAPNQSAPRFAPLPPGTLTRAVLSSAIATRNMPPYLRLLAPRLINHTPEAVANADSEFTTSPYLSAPYTYDAGHITRGYNQWINSGPNGAGLNARPPISDIAPSWFVLSWPEKRRVDGVLLEDNFEQFDLQIFNGAPGINAAAATDEEWKTIHKFKQVIAGGHRWITFAAEQTSAVRLHITKTGQGAVAWLAGFHVFADLGDKPVPVVAGPVQQEPPAKIPYTLAQEGQVTLVVDGPDGVRVRNLIANVQQPAGANTVPWDLKDENGAYVPPGKYHWKAITHPPLELRYEMTAYPNVTSYFPERPAWLNGANGSAGWLADHTAPHAVCIAGDSVFIGAPVAESGVALAECDLEGRKLWGLQSFAAWTGSWMLASDGKTVFNVANPGGGPESVWALDVKTHAVHTVTTLQPTAQRKRGLRGIAARDNKVYLAIHSTDDFLSNAVSPEDADSPNCLPAYPPARAPHVAHEIVPNPRGNFLRLFRLAGMPPGQGDLTWLESTNNPDRQQDIVLAFTKPVAIGSLVFPPPPKEEKVQFQISILKPDASYPPRPRERGDWQVVPLTDKSAWAVQALPPGTMTRAVRLSFVRGGEGAGEDLLSDVEKKSDVPMDDLDPNAPKKSTFESANEGSWQRKLEGMKLLSRRFENLFGTATVRVNSGKILPDGTWNAQRTEPLSSAEPAIYAMEWKQPQPVHGLAIKEIDGAETEVDVYTGPAGGPVDIEANEGWEKVASYSQPLRNYYNPDPTQNTQARYLDGYVDFGREISTRAVRLRVVKQWDTKAGHPTGMRIDQGGQTLDLKRCHIYGIAPLKYLGGEKPADPLATERLEVLDAATGKIVQEVPLPNVGGQNIYEVGNVLAFNPQGELFAISDRKLVRVDLTGGNPQILASDLLLPTALACDGAGNLFVFDAAKDRKNIRVYDPAGKFVRAIGTPGGHPLGAWDPNRMDYVGALAVDGHGQVWAVEQGMFPKRVSLWSNEGKFLKEFLGPTEYGGGGCLDPGDKRSLFYGPMEFELDWQTGKTRLKAITSFDGLIDAGDVPKRVDGRLYLTNVRPNTFGTACGLVYLHEGDHSRIVAAVGNAGRCRQMLDPKLVKAFGGKVLLDYLCVWSDLNGDGQVQPEEVQLWPKPKDTAGVMFDSKLNAQVGSIGFHVKQWLPNGVPVYERVDSPGQWSGLTLRLDNGNFYHFEEGDHAPLCGVLKPDGKPLWTYRTEGPGVHALTSSKALYPGQIVCELGFAGHATAHEGDLGEFVVFNTNVGVFNIMTADGLFAGQIFRDCRDPLARTWSGPDNARGTRLDNITPGQEHFSGYFCRTEDNHYYAVAGHNHASVVEVAGMDRFKRFEGDITIGTPELATAQAWDHAVASKQVFARAPVVDCYRMAAPPKLDGQLNDWPFVSAQLDANAKFRIGYDDDNLYLAYEISKRGPLKNKGQQWDRLFKTGASVDLQIATDPNAPADRRAPVAGDQRLLMTFMGDEPAAVLYKAVVPGTPPAKVWQVVSPVGSASFDSVTQLEKPKLFAVGDDDHYVLEASIPLSTMGLKITPGLRLKMDWGVLVSGPDGTEVLRREYWANKATQITADAPSEAELHPDLWGHVRFHAEPANAHMDPITNKPDKALDDLLNDLK